MKFTEEDKEMVARLIKGFEKDLDELRNDKYGHAEIVSDLKESCREKIDWLETFQARMAEEEEKKENPEPYEVLKNFVDGIPRWSLGYVYNINGRLVAAHSLEEAVGIYRQESTNVTIESIKLMERDCAYIQNEIPLV